MLMCTFVKLILNLSAFKFVGEIQGTLKHQEAIGRKIKASDCKGKVGQGDLMLQLYHGLKIMFPFWKLKSNL